MHAPCTHPAQYCWLCISLMMLNSAEFDQDTVCKFPVPTSSVDQGQVPRCLRPQIRCSSPLCVCVCVWWEEGDSQPLDTRTRVGNSPEVTYTRAPLSTPACRTDMPCVLCLQRDGRYTSHMSSTDTNSSHCTQLLLTTVLQKKEM